MAAILHKELSDRVIGAAFKVHNVLGPGLLESAYEGALVIELKRRGLAVERQVVYPLIYEGEMAGAYIADIVVENAVVLELKSVKILTAVMEAQLLNYLRLSAVPVGYLINFRNPRLEFQRRVLTRRVASSAVPSANHPDEYRELSITVPTGGWIRRRL